MATAFCIAVNNGYQALFLTAHHNISAWIGDPNPGLALGLPSLRQSGDAQSLELSWFPIYSFGVHETYTDIAVVCVDLTTWWGPPAVQPRPLSQWDSSRPKVDAKFVALGYSGLDGIATLISSPGKVEFVHTKGRDQAIDFPAVQTDADLVWGMSGGPLVTEEGRVFAVVSRGLGGSPEEDIPATGYGSLIGSALLLSIQIRDPQEQTIKEVRLRDLAAADILKGTDRVRVVRGPDGVTMAWPDEPEWSPT